MLATSRRTATAQAALAVLVLLMLTACGGGDGEPQTPSPEPTLAPEPVVITIGNLADLTGPTSYALSIINVALADTVEYYNDRNLIPGVKLEVITYDGQYDPSNDIPGYEWLKEKGADLMYSAVAPAGLTLKSRLEKDQMVLFLLPAGKEAFVPPGYVFAPGYGFSESLGCNSLSWIAENDPGFPSDRRAKVGGGSLGGALWRGDPGGSGSVCEGSPGPI